MFLDKSVSITDQTREIPWVRILLSMYQFGCRMFGLKCYSVQQPFVAMASNSLNEGGFLIFVALCAPFWSFMSNYCRLVDLKLNPLLNQTAIEPLSTQTFLNSHLIGKLLIYPTQNLCRKVTLLVTFRIYPSQKPYR